MTVMSFLEAAIPWIAVGLFFAITMTVQNRKNQAAQKGEKFEEKKWMLYAPSLILFLLALWKFYEKDNGSASTWLVLAIAIFFINSMKKN